MSSPSNYNLGFCHCGSKQVYKACCEPFILGLEKPNTAEQLMRSRFSAYVVGAYQYIIDTYHVSSRPAISAESLAQDDLSTHWLNLDVLSASHSNKQAYVSFKAISRSDSHFYCLHEKSRFILENGHWFYVDGEMLSETGRLKPGRNTDCVCGSGKKFKRCCG